MPRKKKCSDNGFFDKQVPCLDGNDELTDVVDLSDEYLIPNELKEFAK